MSVPSAFFILVALLGSAGCAAGPVARVRDPSVLVADGYNGAIAKDIEMGGLSRSDWDRDAPLIFAVFAKSPEVTGSAPPFLPYVLVKLVFNSPTKAHGEALMGGKGGSFSIFNIHGPAAVEFVKEGGVWKIARWSYPA